MQCSIKGISVNYEVIGEGSPILIIHGFFVDHRLMKGCMEPVFEKKSGYKRIYIDLPGMGKSESAKWIKSADDMLNVIIEFINRVIPDENFLIAGQSYGGYMTRGVVYRMPQRIDGVLLICPVIVPDREKRDVPKHEVILKDENLLSRLSKDEADDFNSCAVAQTQEIYKRYKEEILCGINIADKKFLQNFQKEGYRYSFDVDGIKYFCKPSLIITGKQDSCVGYKDAWNILRNFPRATFSVLDKSGHNLHIEQEKLFFSLVEEWLERVKESKMY